MRNRGRPSPNDLSVVPLSLPQRPDPPEDLSPAEAALWHDFVDDMPPDWFPRRYHHLLRALCGLVADSEELRREIRSFKGKPPEDVKDLDRYLKLHKESRSKAQSIATLSTKLRLTQTSRTNDPHRAEKDRTAIQNTGTGRKPWE